MDKHEQEIIESLTEEIKKLRENKSVTLPLEEYTKIGELIQTLRTDLQRTESIQKPYMVVRLSGTQFELGHNKLVYEKMEELRNITQYGAIMLRLDDNVSSEHTDPRFQQVLEKVEEIAQKNANSIEVMRQSVAGLNKATDRYAYQLARLPWYLRWAVKPEKDGN